MAALYTSEAGTLPGEADMAAMLSDHIRDVALAREARRLGLDQNDTIITRRLAQKMSFVVSDLHEDTMPTERQLEDWHAAHADRFTRPATLTFSHVYFSPDVRGAETAAAAEETLTRLNASNPPAAASLGDPFMLQRQYGDMPLRELARQFGAEAVESPLDLSRPFQQCRSLKTGKVPSPLLTGSISFRLHTQPQLCFHRLMRLEQKFARTGSSKHVAKRMSKPFRRSLRGTRSR